MNTERAANASRRRALIFFAWPARVITSEWLPAIWLYSSSGQKHDIFYQFVATTARSFDVSGQQTGFVTEVNKVERGSLTYTNFGGFLKLLRKRVHLTQIELAALVGYSDAQINRFERGVRVPDPSVIEARFIDALGLRSDSTDAIRLIVLAREAAKRLANDGAVGSSVNDTTQALTFAKLPSPATELLGREADIEVVLKIFGRPNTRLLTLVGPPGVGKTRLAIELAQLTESEHQHGALFVALASVTDGSLIADAVLQAMGITSTSQDPLTQLKNVLHKRDMVLVLDNFEQLLEQTRWEVATCVIAELVAAAPNIMFLMTSRAPLRLSGEYIYEVPTLASDVAQTLFVQRARALRPLFNPKQHDEQAITEICRRLDYLPLAIELAAARIRLFEPQALLKRLAEPLPLLTFGPKDSPQRQHTLRSAIEWSYKLLAPDEQTLFRRLSIFADGCTMAMIEDIVAGDLSIPVVDLVQSLVDKSLLKTESVNGEIRFRFLEMLREYASELLSQSDEAVLFAERSAQWFVDYCEFVQADPAQKDNGAWFEWFDTEWNNLRGVMQWSLRTGKLEYGLRLAACFGVTWRLHGPLHDGWQIIQQVLAHARSTDVEDLRAAGLLAAAHVAEGVGDAAKSESYAREGLAIARRIGSTFLTGQLLALIADHASARGEYDTARVLFTEGISHSHACGDLTYVVSGLLWLSAVDNAQSAHDIALARCTEATHIAREIGWSIGMFMADLWTSGTLFEMGQLDRALALAESALEICETNKLTLCTHLVCGQIGAYHIHSGNYKQAVEVLSSVVAEMGLFGDPDTQASMSVSLGLAMHLNGDSAQAEGVVLKAIHSLCQCARTNAIPDALMLIGWIAVINGGFCKAVQMMSAGESLTHQFGAMVSAHMKSFQDKHLSIAKSAMNADAFNQCWREGQAMNLNAAVRCAMDAEVD